MIQRSLGLAIRVAAIALLGAVQLAWVLQPIPWSLKLFHIALLTLSCAHPESALLVLASVGLLSTPISNQLGSEVPGGKLLEQMVLAVVTGALVRNRRSEGATRLGPMMLLYGVVAAASLLMLLPTRLAMGMPGASPLDAVRALWRHDYFFADPLWLPLYLAMLAVESALLAWTVERAVRRRAVLADHLLDAFLIGAAAQSLLSFDVVLRAATRAPSSWSRWFETFLTVRVNAQTDVNAGASLLLLVLLASASRLRTDRWHIRAALMGLVAMGLWHTGSRMALLSLAGSLGVVGVMQLVRRSSRSRLIAAALAAGLVTAGLVVAIYPRERNSPMQGTIETRLGLAKAALTMTREAPTLGVGLGRFYELSGQYAPHVFYLMNNGKTRENAHNNFLQVLAEEGVVGLLVLLLALGHIFFAPVRPDSASARGRRFWLITAISACLMTWLSGHPLLVGEFAFVFWVYAALASSLTDPPAASWRRLAGVAAMLIVATGVVRGEQERRTAGLEHIGAGLSLWQHDLAIPYRRAGTRFFLYLPAAGAYVTIPIQRVPQAPDPVKLEIREDGRLREAEWIAGSDWTDVRFLMPREKRSFVLFEFVATAPGGSLPHGDLLRVGKAQVR